MKDGTTISKALRLSLIAGLAVLILAFAASAQSGEGIGSGGDSVPHILMEVPENGVGYTQNGELVLVALLTNVGNEASPPLEVTAVLLNDCILPSILQTCRFAAFGVFDNVMPDGIPAGATVQWTFNFGTFPELDLSRWSVVWYQRYQPPSNQETGG